MSAKDKKADSEENVIATNRKARFEYEIIEKLEVGISLLGSEVKSLRNRDVSIAEAFARPKAKTSRTPRRTPLPERFKRCCRVAWIGRRWQRGTGDGRGGRWRRESSG